MLTIAELQAARKAFPVKPLDCPHCGARLNVHFRIVIATRNCPKCGRQVAAEPEGNEGAPPFTREQLESARAAFRRAKRRAMWLIHAGFLAFLGSLFVLLACRQVIRATVGPALDPIWVFMLVMFGPCLMFYFLAFRVEERAARALKCPHCDSPCAGNLPRSACNLTLLTGNCANCGRRLLNEPPPDEPLAPLPTVGEFKAAEAQTPFLSWPAAVLIVPMAMLAGLFVVANPVVLHTVFEQRYGPAVAAVLAFLLTAGYVYGQIALAILAARWLSRRHKRKRAAEMVLNCPHCREALLSGPFTVASQRCPACHKHVLADPETAPVLTGRVVPLAPVPNPPSTQKPAEVR